MDKAHQWMGDVILATTHKRCCNGWRCTVTFVYGSKFFRNDSIPFMIKPLRWRCVLILMHRATCTFTFSPLQSVRVSTLCVFVCIFVVVSSIIHLADGSNTIKGVLSLSLSTRPNAFFPSNTKNWQSHTQYTQYHKTPFENASTRG